jgi:hypothetical protein
MMPTVRVSMCAQTSTGSPDAAAGSTAASMCSTCRSTTAAIAVTLRGVNATVTALRAHAHAEPTALSRSEKRDGTPAVKASQSLYTCSTRTPTSGAERGRRREHGFESAGRVEEEGARV